MADVTYNDTWIGGTTGGFLIYNIDKASVANMTFIGIAQPNTATSEARWKIIVIDKTTSITRIRYADGDSKFDNIFDDRTTLSYS
jgi:hypothetical protein